MWYLGRAFLGGGAPHQCPLGLTPSKIKNKSQADKKGVGQSCHAYNVDPAAANNFVPSGWKTAGVFAATVAADATLKGVAHFTLPVLESSSCIDGLVSSIL